MARSAGYYRNKSIDLLKIFRNDFLDDGGTAKHEAFYKALQGWCQWFKSLQEKERELKAESGRLRQRNRELNLMRAGFELEIRELNIKIKQLEGEKAAAQRRMIESH